jgi:hypothetical protein
MLYVQMCLRLNSLLCLWYLNLNPNRKIVLFLVVTQMSSATTIYGSFKLQFLHVRKTIDCGTSAAVCSLDYSDYSYSY